MALLKIVLGLVGAASLGGSAWLYLSDGGLALALRDRDQVLQQLDEDDRRQTLEQWSGLVSEYARVRRERENKDLASEQTTQSSPSTSGKSSSPSQAKYSQACDKVFSLVDQLGVRLNEAGSQWRKSGDAKGLEDIVADVRLAYEAALEAWTSFSSVEQALVADTLKEAYTTLRARFGGIHSSYGAALSEGSKLDIEMRELSDRHTLFVDSYDN